MLKINRKKLVLLALIATMVGLLVATAGCAGVGSQAQPQVVYPTVVLVQYVTQVVATVTPAAPAVAGAAAPQAAAAVAAVAPSSTPQTISIDGYYPLEEDIYYPLMGCQVASRLEVGEKAFVANGGGRLGLYQSQDIGYAPEYRKLEAGEVVDIIGGPYCERSSLVWQVIGSDGTKGYTAEGDGNTYWLLPYGELVEKSKLKATPDRGLRLGLPANCTGR